MPKEGPVGYGEFTALKESQYREWIGAHMRMVRGILAKPGCRAVQAYHLFDLTAGTGYSAREPGSVLIATKAAVEEGVPLSAWLFERHRRTLAGLTRNIEGEAGDLQIVAGDHNETLPGVAAQFAGARTWRYGVAYWDASGDARFPCEVVRELVSLPCFEVLDVLAYLAPANSKRALGAGLEGTRVSEIIEQVGKRYAHIRRPLGNHQWTFLALTNWAGLPEFTRMGFRRVEEPEGDSLVDRLSFSRKEREARCGQSSLFELAQPSLFDGRGRVRR